MPGSSISVGATNVPRCAMRRQRQLEHRPSALAHPRDVRHQRRARLGVDHRADVGRKAPRIADRELAHRALQHREHVVGDVVLHAQHAQRRAALSCTVERRHDRIRHDLLGQRRAVDDHRVLPAGLGDQHGIVGAEGELPMDEARDVGRAREEHAGDPRIGDERRTDGLARTRQQLQRGSGHAGAMEEPHRLVRDQRRLLGGLCEHGIARRERGARLTDEDRQRKIPRRDRDHRSERTASGIARASLA